MFPRTLLTRFTRLAPGLLLVLVLSGCGESTDVSVTGPSISRCGVTATVSTSSVPAAGGSGTVAISTERECEWVAASESDWLTLNPSKGQGPGSLGYTAAANPNSSSRRGALVVGQQRLEIAQEAAPCRYDVVPASVTAPAEETRVSVTVTTAGGCRWNAQSTTTWLRANPAEGAGPASIQLSVAPNTGPDRAATLSVAGVTVSVSQAASSPVTCAYVVTPGNLDVPAAGAQSALTVTTAAGCAWTATADAAWIAILEGASGRGPGSVRVSIPANDGARRSGAVLVGGRPVGVSQEGRQSCTYSISPTSRSVGREGAQFAVEVNAAPNCGWTATSESSWITVTAGGSGNGNGSVALAVAANPGEARSGRVLIAGQPFTVQQAGTAQCSYSIKPLNYNAGTGADEVTVQVNATQGCTWAVSGEPAWVTVAEGRSGSGNGAVRLLISANSGAPRDAILTVAGQPFTVSQEGSCAATITPTQYNAGRGPDEFEVQVTAASGCRWTATSPVDWARIQAGATGSGSGTVTVRVNPNNDAARNAELTIAGQRFMLTQSGR